MKPFLFIGMAVACVSSQAALINFDDGTDGNPIGTHYPGLTFIDGSWTDNFGLAGSSGPLGLMHTTANFQPVASNPIEIIFDTPQASVSIRGIDVGERGAQINAYDGSGNLLASDSAFGPGVGIGFFFDIAVSSASIKRVTLFQPNEVASGDGMLWEDLNYSDDVVATPEISASIALFGLALAGLSVVRRKAQ